MTCRQHVRFPFTKLVLDKVLGSLTVGNAYDTPSISVVYVNYDEDLSANLEVLTAQ